MTQQMRTMQRPTRTTSPHSAADAHNTAVNTHKKGGVLSDVPSPKRM